MDKTKLTLAGLLVAALAGDVYLVSTGKQVELPVQPGLVELSGEAKAYFDEQAQLAGSVLDKPLRCAMDYARKPEGEMFCRDDGVAGFYLSPETLGAMEKAAFNPDGQMLPGAK